MINYFAALAIITAIGAVIGWLMVRREVRHMDRTFRALREEMERRANTHPITSTAEVASPVDPQE